MTTVSHRDARSLGALLNGVLLLVVVAVVWLGQAQWQDFNGTVDSAAAQAQHLIAVHHCWSSPGSAPKGVIPGHVVTDRGYGGVKATAAALTGHFKGTVWGYCR